MNTREKRESPLLTIDELGAKLGISRTKVLTMVKQGAPCLRLGKGLREPVRFDWHEVQNWMRDCAREKAAVVKADELDDGSLFATRELINPQKKT